MLKNFLSALWRSLPGKVRRRAVRIGQKQFTVTTAAIIVDDEGRVLLLDHVFRPDGGWGVPGGFLAHDEQPEEGMRRELREEIDLEVDHVRVAFARALPWSRQVEIYYRAKAVGVPKPSSIEIKHAEWFAVDQLPVSLSTDQRRLIERALSDGERPS